VRAALAAVAALVALAAGCGNRRAPDLFALQRSGQVPGARMELRVRDDGQLSCNGGALRRLPDRLLLDAREIARELNALDPRTLPRAAQPVLSYRVRVEHGTFRFDDASPGQKRPMLNLQGFTRAVARGVCGLPR
jgi:hypothetical protein